MSKFLLKKTLVIGTILVLLGMVILPSISSINNQFAPLKNSFSKKVKFNPFKEGWEFRKMITINHNDVVADLVNFPVLVRTIDYDLRDKAQDDGDDILFMKHPGKAEQLFHEIESYDGDSGELVAWVNIPRLSSHSDTKFYMYYGNPNCSSQGYHEKVWDSNYKSVWHLAEKGTGLRFDSTINSNDASPKDYEGDEGVDYGKINGADEFDGDNDHLRTGVSFDYDYRTISFWINTDIKPSSDPNTILSQNAHTLKYGLIYANIQSDGLHAKAGGEGPGEEFIFDININSWYFVQLIRDHNVTRYYVNGNLIDTGNSGDIGAEWYPNPNLVIGASRYYDRLYDGIIDELRVSDIVRSSDWINTSYNTMNDPLNFLSFDSEEKPLQKTLNFISFQSFLEHYPMLEKLLTLLLL
jgi:MSHA biogenesis protein MshQ